MFWFSVIFHFIQMFGQIVRLNELHPHKNRAKIGHWFFFFFIMRHCFWDSRELKVIEWILPKLRHLTLFKKKEKKDFNPIPAGIKCTYACQNYGIPQYYYLLNTLWSNLSYRLSLSWVFLFRWKPLCPIYSLFNNLISPYYVF